MVPMGCQQLQVQALKTRGRGTVTTDTPSAGNGFRGAIHIHDPDGAADVYDVRVTLTCIGGSSSVPQVPVRLSCTHNYGTDACHMGRIEVFNPTAEHLQGTGRGTWGTVPAPLNNLLCALTNTKFVLEFCTVLTADRGDDVLA